MMDSYKLSDVLTYGTKTLRENDQPEIGARFLLMDLFSLSQMDIVMNEKKLSQSQWELYQSGIERLCENEPLSHIIGWQYFYGERFKVTPDTLTPRPETEHLIDVVKSHLKRGDVVADIGTGTGIIAITLARLEAITMYAVDISERALVVANENVDTHQANVTFLQGDLLQPLIEQQIKLDVLVSNPPYIAESERHLMNAQALQFDPHIALFAEDDGLALYKRMIEDLKYVMKPNALVAFEIGHAQSEALMKFIHVHYPNVKVNVEQDINQLDRVLWFHWCE